MTRCNVFGEQLICCLATNKLLHSYDDIIVTSREYGRAVVLCAALSDPAISSGVQIVRRGEATNAKPN